MKRWAAVLAAAGVLAALWLWPIDLATVRLPRRGDELAAAMIAKPGSELRLSYRHSVEKGRVVGVFGIAAGPKLTALETRMDSVGTGLPNTAPERTRRQGDWLVVDEKGVEIPGFSFFLSAINQTSLSLDGKKINLDGLRSGSLLFIDAERVVLGRYLLWLAGGPSWPRRGEAR